LPGNTSSRESGIMTRHARTASTEPNALPSLVITSVGQRIWGKSALMLAFE
jgi:hypothetical protein